jgi:hypothetical protein
MGMGMGLIMFPFSSLALEAYSASRDWVYYYPYNNPKWAFSRVAKWQDYIL